MIYSTIFSLLLSIQSSSSFVYPQNTMIRSMRSLHFIRRSLSTTSNHLSTVQFDSLKGVSAESKKAISEVLKHKYLTKVQNATLDTVLEGNDIVAKAKTGTGKTLAFLLPVVENCINQKASKKSNISGLIVSPTRELAIQIHKEAEELTKFHNLKIGCFIGGTKIHKDISQLNQDIDILVGTPGRLIDHLKSDTKGMQGRVSGLKTLVLDEADRLLDMGFKSDIETIVKYLPSERQTVLYSATFPKSVESIAKMALKPQHTMIDTIEKGEQESHTQITQQVMECTIDNLIESLEIVLAEHVKIQKDYKVIVFFSTARTAGFAAKLFQKAGFNALEMHSRKSQSYRAKVSEKFHKGKNVIMFSSDVSARGVDYPDVSLVVQIGLTTRDQYTHRVGRTGRAGKTGKGILIACDFEKPLLDSYLRGLNIESVPLPPSSPNQLKVTAITRRLPTDLQLPAEQAYQAYLGFYASNFKQLNLRKEAIIKIANSHSQTMGLQTLPILKKSTVSKMGLKGVPGLKIY